MMLMFQHSLANLGLGYVFGYSDDCMELRFQHSLANLGLGYLRLGVSVLEQSRRFSILWRILVWAT